MKIKHCFQRFAAVMACLMLGMFCLPGAAHAAGYVQLTGEQMNARCSLTLDYQIDATAFRLYKVAEMDENVRFTLTEQFAQYPVFAPNADGSVKINELTSEGWTSLANTLKGYVSRDSEELEAAATASVENNKLVFANLPVGLYLMIGDANTVNGTTYTPTPVLVALPNWENSMWNFDLTGEVKYTTYTPSGGGGDSDNTIQRSVLKVWEDDGFEDERPGQITVDLLRDGQVYDTAVLSAGNNWRANWSGLSPNYDWQLVEREGAGSYQVSVALEGITFVVTNTYLEDIDEEGPPLVDVPDGPGDGGTDLDDDGTPLDGGPNLPGDGDAGEELIDIEDEDPPLADLPQTGQLWWPVPLLALAGAALCVLGLAGRGKRSDHAE